MPLIRCDDCEREVSDQASACPQCGRPITITTRGERVRTAEDNALTRNRGCADMILWPFMVVVILALLWLAA